MSVSITVLKFSSLLFLEDRKDLILQTEKTNWKFLIIFFFKTLLVYIEPDITRMAIR